MKDRNLFSENMQKIQFLMKFFSTFSNEKFRERSTRIFLNILKLIASLSLNIPRSSLFDE